MNLNIFKTSVKSALLASVLFWVLTSLRESLNEDVFFLWFISVFIFFIISFFMIIFTILPFYTYLEEKLSKKQFFTIYFPYYALIFFTASFTILYSEGFDGFLLIILTTAFFTAMQSWVWLFKTNND